MLRRSTRAFLAFLMLLAFGFVVAALAVSAAPAADSLLLMVMVAVGTGLAVAMPVHVGPQRKQTLFGAAIFAAVLLLEPGPACISVGLGSAVAQILRRVPSQELVFNALQTTLQAAAGGLVLWWTERELDAFAVWDAAVVPILLSLLAIEAVNVLLVAGVISVDTGQPFGSAVRGTMPYDLGALVAPYALGLLTAVVANSQPWALALLGLLAVEVHRSSKRHAELHVQATVMEYQALHDALTDLPNRRLFAARVEQALARAARHHRRLAVMVVDLDRFKNINDTLGHPAGDKVLVSVAQRVSDRIRLEDTLARQGGDEFTLLVEDIDDTGEAEAVALRLGASIRDPIVIDDQRVAVTASVGIALSQPGATTVDDLIKQADIALYRAKSNGGDAIAFYEDRDNAFSLERMALEMDLRLAVENGELRLHYQPQVDLATTQVTGVEALMRWEHPGRGLLPPAEFLPIAEESGLILPLGRWVLHAACHQAALWFRQWADRAPVVYVNLSVRQIREADFCNEVHAALEAACLPPRLLGLEVTESMLLERTEETLRNMQRLKSAGIRLALDDFGSGFSGLSYLKQIPADELKIDRSFIRGLAHDPGDWGIVNAVQSLAHSLDMRVVAEGIETAGQLVQVRRIGCDVGQGYYFSRPVPPEDLTRLLVDEYRLSS